jgi:hypothetical protein
VLIVRIRDKTEDMQETRLLNRITKLIVSSRKREDVGILGFLIVKQMQSKATETSQGALNHDRNEFAHPV